MEIVKKARGAWMIHVKGPDNAKGAGAECSSTPSGDTLDCNEQRYVKDEKEE